MSEEPYIAYEKDHEQMILRDYLAVDRTMMANETSFMSYVRTALTMIAAGATLIKFFNEPTMQALGWAFIVIGGWVAIHGYNRFRQIDVILHKVKGETVVRAQRLKRSKKIFSSTLKFILGR
jgi:putative membrane protein